MKEQLSEASDGMGRSLPMLLHQEEEEARRRMEEREAGVRPELSDEAAAAGAPKVSDDTLFQTTSYK